MDEKLAGPEIGEVAPFVVEVDNALTSALVRLAAIPLGVELADRLEAMGTGGWSVSREVVPSIRPLWSAEGVDWEALAEPLGQCIRAAYPQYLGLVGGPAHRVRVDAAGWLRALVAETWRRSASLSPDPSETRRLAVDLHGLLAHATLRRPFVAPLLNLTLAPDVETDALEIAGVTLRRLTLAELTEIYLAAPFGGVSSIFSGLPQCGLVGEVEEPLMAGALDPDGAAKPPIDLLRERLDRAVLALRTFKAGAVGYQSIHFLKGDLFLLGVTSFPVMREYVAAGSFAVEAADVEPLMRHGSFFSEVLEPALEVACERLSTASTRQSARDHLIDAVIGLEAILLYGPEDKAYKGELRYRFSLNYSTFFDTAEERYAAFRLARDLYDARSSIAHGGNAETVRLRGRSAPIAEAADEACSVLRGLVWRFLPSGSSPDFARQGYYDRAYFGLPPE